MYCIDRSNFLSDPTQSTLLTIRPPNNMATQQDVPKKFGVLLYPGFEVLDVFGPLEALNVISRKEFNKPNDNLPYIEGISLTVITTEDSFPLHNVTAMTPGSNPRSPGVGATITPAFVPDCTYENVPDDLEVLLIPGGLGTEAVTEDQEVINWINSITPNLKYLITVCTGAEIAAKAGVLDGLKATTNKNVWDDILTKDYTKNTYWVAHARWVESSPKIWTTSGVSAGTDGFITWLDKVYGKGYGDKVCKWMEYVVIDEKEADRFSAGLPDIDFNHRVIEPGSCESKQEASSSINK